MLETVLKALDIYNKYHSPESKAELLKIEDNKIYIKFEGIFCKSCGVYDWIEDFKYILEEFNIKTELEIIEKDNYFIGIFKIIE
ncbi:hypothetical protein ACPB8Q_00175 [Methanocaldococcus indicus]|uniref:hypothetical protein n=1 Tax=Methanocaldococcus indicus TaxID=213231 RepID=UPI003C6CD497